MFLRLKSLTTQSFKRFYWVSWVVFVRMLEFRKSFSWLSSYNFYKTHKRQFNYLKHSSFQSPPLSIYLFDCCIIFFSHFFPKRIPYRTYIQSILASSYCGGTLRIKNYQFQAFRSSSLWMLSNSRMRVSF